MLLFAHLHSYAQGFTYQSAVRLSNGNAISKAEIRISASIVYDINSPTSIYSEDHFTYTDEGGMINIAIGDGIPNSGSWIDIDWSKSVFLRVATIVDGKEHVIGTSSILGAPKAFASGHAYKLISTSANGSKWELKINNVGDLSWSKITIDTPPYPQEKWPEQLYLVGNITNDWDPASSKKFTKLTSGRFIIQQSLKHGDIIKFIKVQSWNGGIDWSGTTGIPDIKEPLKEGGDTPAFEGTDGLYKVLVDFSTFTLRIYPAN